MFTFSLDELELKPAYFSVCTSLEISFLANSLDPCLIVSLMGLVAAEKVFGEVSLSSSIMQWPLKLKHINVKSIKHIGSLEIQRSMPRRVHIN